MINKILKISIFFSATKEEMMKLNGMPNEDYNHKSCEPSTVKIRPVSDA